jgi:hypothetical protein
MSPPVRPPRLSRSSQAVRGTSKAPGPLRLGWTHEENYGRNQKLGRTEDLDELRRRGPTVVNEGACALRNSVATRLSVLGQRGAAAVLVGSGGSGHPVFLGQGRRAGFVVTDGRVGGNLREASGVGIPLNYAGSYFLARITRACASDRTRGSKLSGRPRPHTHQN